MKKYIVYTADFEYIETITATDRATAKAIFRKKHNLPKDAFVIAVENQLTIE